MQNQDDIIFLSYAREDQDVAEKINKDLSSAGLHVWFDKESLLPGQKWKVEIKRAIRECMYFIALLSSKSVSKKGYVQKELVEALDTLDEFPELQIFIIPVRVEDCKPSHDKLQELHWVDLFPSYADGIQKLLSVFKPIQAEPKTVSELPLFSADYMFDSIPTVEINVQAPKTQKSVKISAVIDTGADISVISERDLEKLGTNLPYSFVKVVDITGQQLRVRTH